MPLLLYNLFLLLYVTAIKAYGLFNTKARKWVTGRQNWQRQLQALKPNEKRIWIHCSSLGEFEQGRPLIEQIKKQYPRYKIVLTFFSPSGYDACKGYKGADYIYYLPMDGSSNAKKFIAIVQPSLALFVKYEFWYYYLDQLKKKKHPCPSRISSLSQRTILLQVVRRFVQAHAGLLHLYFCTGLEI